MDNLGNMEVHDSTQEGIDVMEFDAPGSPDASYSNSFPGNEDEAKDPPTVPPHLQHTLLNSPVNVEASGSLPHPQNVILNHLYIGNAENTRQMVALGLTHRFRSKFVTVVLYKPARRRGM